LKPQYGGIAMADEGFKRKLWAYRFAPFIASKPHFSGIQFDSLIKNAIGSRYPFSICNILRKFDIWVSLNISVIGDNL
jgi:hypothetical protein